MTTNEEYQLTLKVDGGQMQDEFNELKKKARELSDDLRIIEKNSGKGSEEWKKYKAELMETLKASEKLAAEMKKLDIADMTLGQLENHIKALNRELKGCVIGTQQYIDVTKRLDEAKEYIAKSRDQVKEVKEEAEKLAEPTLWGKVSMGVKSMAMAFNAFIALQVIQYIVAGFTAIISKFTEFEDAAQDLSLIHI